MGSRGGGGGGDSGGHFEEQRGGDAVRTGGGRRMEPVFWMRLLMLLFMFAEKRRRIGPSSPFTQHFFSFHIHQLVIFIFIFSFWAGFCLICAFHFVHLFPFFALVLFLSSTKNHWMLKAR